MLTIGCHLSISKGFAHMGREAESIGANTFQFFSRNPRGSKTKKINPEDINGLSVFLNEKDFGKVLAHAPYTLNPCSKDEKVREFAYMVMKEDLENLELLPGNYYNFHPGSHVGQGVEKGTELICALLNDTLKEEQSTVVLLETMAGKGSEIGGRFEEIRDIIIGVDLKNKIGVCLDTCHIFDGGYDIVNNLEGVLEDFNNIIGIDKLKAIHINDSLNTLGSHKDRHAKIGEGNIGIDAFEKIINHKALRELPFYLETPNELEGYQREIQILRDLYK